MRRNTLTPARSRLNGTVPSTPTGYYSQPSGIRRDHGRNPRDPQYMATSIEMINEYLQISTGNEQIPLLTDRCPSYKHFQSIFKRIVSYFNPNMDSRNITSFGDEAHAIIKNMKYPYSNELNKSHLTTTNPHSWPMILSFLRWLVEMIHLCEKSSLCTEKALTDGYRKFMEGDDHFYEQKLREKNGKENGRNMKLMEQLSALNDALHGFVSNRNHGILKDTTIMNKLHLNSQTSQQTERGKATDSIGNLSEALEDETTLGDLIERTTAIQSEHGPSETRGSPDSSVLRNKLNDLLADKRSILSNFPPLEQKENRYLESIRKLTEEIESVDTDTPLRERDGLKTIMTEQKAKIKNIEQQTSLKNGLILQLEQIKKEKQAVYEQSNGLDTHISEKWDQHERYRHELMTMLNNIVDSNRGNYLTSSVNKTEQNTIKNNEMHHSHDSEARGFIHSNAFDNPLGVTPGGNQNIDIGVNANEPWFSEESFLREINTLSELTGFKKSVTKESIGYEKVITNDVADPNIQYTEGGTGCTFKDRLNDLIAQLEYAVTVSKEHHSESVNGLNSLKGENITKNKRIISLSKIFLEKKEIYEKMSIRTKNEMIKLENELMVLSTSSSDNLLQSEQAVHYNSIKREKMDSFIQMEQTEIEMVVGKFYNEMSIEIEGIRELMNKK